MENGWTVLLAACRDEEEIRETASGGVVTPLFINAVERLCQHGTLTCALVLGCIERI